MNPPALGGCLETVTLEVGIRLEPTSAMLRLVMGNQSPLGSSYSHKTMNTVSQRLDIKHSIARRPSADSP